VAASRALGRKKNAAIVPGKPLPQEGACKHYKQSFRWLVFPCCDTAYACDACHDEVQNHVPEWAKRMICGHCAREQPFSNALCVSCCGSMRRATIRTSFWEGGEGQRNPAMMNKHDSRKHSQSVYKTRSAKASRVGTGPKEKAAAVQTYERYKSDNVKGEVETVVVRKKTIKKPAH
jgi:uncharacterized CHY-type Zn-finger protein